MPSANSASAASAVQEGIAINAAFGFIGHRVNRAAKKHAAARHASSFSMASFQSISFGSGRSSAAFSKLAVSAFQSSAQNSKSDHRDGKKRPGQSICASRSHLSAKNAPIAAAEYTASCNGIKRRRNASRMSGRSAAAPIIQPGMHRNIESSFKQLRIFGIVFLCNNRIA